MRSLLRAYAASPLRYSTRLLSRSSQVMGICILAPIGPGKYQIKNSITFVHMIFVAGKVQLLTHSVCQPEAPKGVPEDLLGTVIEEMQEKYEHVSALTFGTSAAEDINFEHFAGGWRIKYLGKVYRESASWSRRHRISCGRRLDEHFRSSTLTLEIASLGHIIEKYHLAERGQSRISLDVSLLALAADTRASRPIPKQV